MSARAARRGGRARRMRPAAAGGVSDAARIRPERGVGLRGQGADAAPARSSVEEGDSVTHKPAGLAKTTRPSLSSVLPRERLFRRVDEARGATVLWLTGPPGSGKTTLVASWLESRGMEAIWYQVDRGDADPATFFYYMGEAGARASPARARPLLRLAPEYLADLGAFTRRYFRELFSRLEPRFALVLDGYHEVPPQSAFHEVVRDGLAEIPGGGCAIIVSRSDPPPQLVRLRANEQLLVLGWNDLRLSREESDAIVRMRGEELSAEALGTLYERTQGWPAGLVLLLEHVRTEGLLEDPPAAYGPQLVFEYLGGEIFHNLDARMQAFLLRSACLPQMTAGMAQQMSGHAKAGRLLTELTRNNYFVTVRRVQSEPVYQYHPLFREFLLSRARETSSAEQWSELLHRAAELLEADGQIEDAVAAVVELEDWDALVQLVNRHAVTMLDHGRGETLAQWLEYLPAETLRGDPWMYYWLGACRFPFTPREGRRLYERAFELFEAQPEPDPKGLLLSCSGVIDSILHELDDLTLLDGWIPVLEGLLRRFPEFPNRAVEARVTSSMFMSLVLRQPTHPEIEQWVERAFTVSQSIRDPNLRMSVELLVAISFMWTGRFGRALQVIDIMRELGSSPEVSPLALTTLRNVESMYYMLIGMHEPCLAAVTDGLEIGRNSGVHIWSYQLLANGVAAALGAGDLPTAERLLKEMESRPEGARRLDLCLYHYFSAWHAMLKRDTLRAFQHQKTALRFAVEVGVPFFEVLCRLALAQVLFQCGDERKGAMHLQQVHDIARDIRNRWLEFIALLCYAQIALDHGRKRSALNSLRYAMGLGREHGYTHFLWWQPEVMARLCAHALEAGIEVDYVRDLIRRRELMPEPPPLNVEAWPWRFRIRTLGEFDLLRDGEPRTLSRKGQGRRVQLLKALIAFGGRDVSVDRLADTMWPRIDSDYAHRSLTTTLHRLRRLLGEDGALVLREGRLSLDRRLCWVDVWALEQVLDEIDALCRSGRRDAAADTLGRLAQRALALYRGPFMGEDAEEPHFVPLREHLRNRFLRSMGEVGHFLERRGHWDEALEYYQRGLEVDGVAEGLYRRLMLCYRQLGRRAEALEVYTRCRRTLAAALQVEPSPETTALYERLLEET